MIRVVKLIITALDEAHAGLVLISLALIVECACNTVQCEVPKARVELHVWIGEAEGEIEPVILGSKRNVVICLH